MASLPEQAVRTQMLEASSETKSIVESKAVNEEMRITDLLDDTVKKFLTENHDFNLDTKINEVVGGFTPLLFALSKIEDELAIYLLNNCPNIEVHHIIPGGVSGVSPTVFGFDALHLAVWCGMEECVNLILQKNPNGLTHIPNCELESHLFLDAARTTPNIVSMLLKAGCDINQISKDYGAYSEDNDPEKAVFPETALQVSAIEQPKKTEITRLLIKQGAKNLKNRHGLTALGLLERRQVGSKLFGLGEDCSAMIELLTSVESFFRISAEGDCKRATELLTAELAYINQRDEKGRTPLHLSVLANQVFMVRLLIEHGADLTARDDDGVPLSISQYR